MLIDGKLRFYYWGTRRTDKRDGQEDIRWLMHIGIASLRRDGFISLNAGDKTGTVTTRPLTFTGDRLFVIAEIADGGSIRAAVLSSEGQPLPDYLLDDAMTIRNGAESIPVIWKQQVSIHRPANQHVRLQFQLRNAKLYSFWID